MNLVTTMTSGHGEDTFGRALNRARAEFLATPDLKLTVDQAARRWACHPDVCVAVMATLVESRFLVRTKNSTFSRTR
jgi:hypothetical protein